MYHIAYKREGKQLKHTLNVRGSNKLAYIGHVCAEIPQYNSSSLLCHGRTKLLPTQQDVYKAHACIFHYLI